MRQSTIDNALRFDERAKEHGIGNDGTITPSQVEFLVRNYSDLKRPSYLQSPENKIGRALYKYWVPTQETKTIRRPVKKIEEQPKAAVEPEAVRDLARTERLVDMNVQTNGFLDNLIPKKDDLFVPFGCYNDLEPIIKSRLFYPVFVTGLSGNGKTYMVEQAAARCKREIIRVNLTRETDEDSLIGGLRLIGGETKFVKGPVIRAMERGAVLLLDEVDLADPARIMCLQSIMEGSGYFIKRTGEYVEPADGFTVVATANTKGKGSETGSFIATNILNEAFLERFPVTFEQPYPTKAIEAKILRKVFARLGLEDTTFIDRLVYWADAIRATYFDGAIDEIISTRRLVHIAKAFAIYGDRLKCIQLCTNRFDEETKESFLEFYTKVDEDATKDAEHAPVDIGDILRQAE